MFHMLKAELRERYPKLAQSKRYDFLFGAFSGILGQVVAYPFDVVRRRMQAQNYLYSHGHVDKIRTVREMVRFIYTNEGIIRGFYKGISVNAIKAPLATGTSFTIKNALNRKLDKNFQL